MRVQLQTDVLGAVDHRQQDVALLTVEADALLKPVQSVGTGLIELDLNRKLAGCVGKDRGLSRFVIQAVQF